MAGILGTFEIKFADADYPLENSEFVLLGVPFDFTSSFRTGSRFAPNAVREASYNFEPYLFDYGIDLKEIRVHDAGNLSEQGSPKGMMCSVENCVKEILKNNSFPVLIGGEHSIAIGAISAFSDIGVISIDAHLDFRDQYLGERYSHACTARRISEIVGLDRIAILGVRSFSREEFEDARSSGLSYIDALELREVGVENGVKKALKALDKEKIYLTLDMDGIDMAFAPGVQNPEPFGLFPVEIKRCIETIADRLVGFDLVEICPPFDNGTTSLLGARIIRDVIGLVWKNQRE